MKTPCPSCEKNDAAPTHNCPDSLRAGDSPCDTCECCVECMHKCNGDD